MLEAGSDEEGVAFEGMFSSLKTFAFATSAKRPDKKSELYDESATASLALVGRFRSVKRTPEEEGTACLAGAAAIAVVAEFMIFIASKDRMNLVWRDRQFAVL
jgi:hypothetical protein